MKTVKLSYSILNTWSKYQYEQAIGMYLGQQLPATPQMELGKAYDELWQAEIESTQKLPDELGGGVLKQPRTQVKYQKLLPLNEDYQILIRGVPDATDGPIIYEFKCGMTEASSYVDTMQADYYKLLYPDATVCEYLCYNPYFKTYTKGIKFLSRANAEQAVNHIYTFGTEIIEYLEANKLLQDYQLTA